MLSMGRNLSGYGITAAGIQILVLSLLAGCSKANTLAEKLSSEKKNSSDWQAMCLGHLLLDTPPLKELGATPVRYDFVYQIKGIGGEEGTWGELRYGKLKVAESVPGNSDSLLNVRNSARHEVISQEKYLKLISAKQAQVQSWSRRATEGSPDEKQAAKSVLSDKKRELDELTHASVVSGGADIDPRDGFGVRIGSDFIVGFQSEEDNRIRIFEGPFTTSVPESPEAASEELRKIRRSYQPRSPSVIPASSGYCTAYGFFSEEQGIGQQASIRMPFQLKEYPNLLFYFDSSPSEDEFQRNPQIVRQRGKNRKMLDSDDSKIRSETASVQILGMPGRMLSQEYEPMCITKNDCQPPALAYAIEAEVSGVPGRADRPHLVLHMSAILSDEHKLKLPPLENTASDKLDYPALRGHVPPPYHVGKEIFQKVLNSIRIRPGAFVAKTSGNSPKAQALKD
jgi:hypothetical protein